MTFPKAALLALALLGVPAAPALATPIDYSLAVTLVESGAGVGATELSLSGTLTYDADLMSGSGTFDFDGTSGTFAGFSMLADYGNGITGVLFDGTGSEGDLYLNLLAGPGAPSVSDAVHYCPGGLCSFYDTVGVNLALASASGVSASDGTTSIPGVSAAVPGVSAVPLPPGGALFASALALLAPLGVARRLMPRRVPARVTRR